jgi:hypothetical protein
VQEFKNKNPAITGCTGNEGLNGKYILMVKKVEPPQKLNRLYGH